MHNKLTPIETKSREDENGLQVEIRYNKYVGNICYKKKHTLKEKAEIEITMLHSCFLRLCIT